MINNTYFRLRFGLVNLINAYLRLKVDVVYKGATPNLRLIMCLYRKPLKKDFLKGYFEVEKLVSNVGVKLSVIQNVYCLGAYILAGV